MAEVEQGIGSFSSSGGGVPIRTYVWESTRAKTEFEKEDIVVLFHGYGSHCRYPTMDIIREELNERFVVAAFDYYGHGFSGGKRGYLPSKEIILRDAATFIKQIRETRQVKKLFIFGQSLGAALGVLFSTSYPELVDGIVMLAPMLEIKAPNWQLWAVSALNYAGIGSWDVIPSVTQDFGMMYRRDDLRATCLGDTLQYSGRVRIGTAATCADICSTIHDNVGKLTTPFIIFFGTQDCIVNPEKAKWLYESSPSENKSFHLIDGGYHCLLGEEKATILEIFDTINDWFETVM